MTVIHCYWAFILIGMWLDQACNGVELREFDMKHYNLIHNFLSKNFKGHFIWLAFDHKFFVSDNCKGRHETMKTLREFVSLNAL